MTVAQKNLLFCEPKLLEFRLKPANEINRLIQIMAALRHPQTGCEWDIKQDFRSIAPYTLEEVYEVLDAIERDDKDDLREELGDLLLQVVFHARMAEEEGSFNFADVAETVSNKMIRRHPHVFGTEEERAKGLTKGAWSRIKNEEKAERSLRRQQAGIKEEKNGYLDDIPKAFPALLRALKIQLKASKVGFDWNDPAKVLEKIEEEIAEFKQAIETRKTEDIQEEFGDLLFAMVNLGRHFKIDPEIALMQANDKFLHRFHYIEQSLDEAGKDLETASLDEMEALWIEAKRLKNNKKKSD